MKLKRKRILVIYTGGTIGMEWNPNTRAPLKPPPLHSTQLQKRLFDHVPEIQKIAHCEVKVLFNLDSCFIGSAHWIQIAQTIQQEIQRYSGVVVLHGTDTLAYTAAALSYLLGPCPIPVILTGSQRPLAAWRSDAHQNLISAVELAASQPHPAFQSDTVFLHNSLILGTRIRKKSASDFNGFESPRFPLLAQVGSEIEHTSAFFHLQPPKKNRSLQWNFSSRILTLHVTPDFYAPLFSTEMLQSVEAILFTLYPSATAPTNQIDFQNLLKRVQALKIPLVFLTEGTGKSIRPDTYSAARGLFMAHAIWAGDMTPECAYVKTSLILGQKAGKKRFQKLWNALSSNDS